MKPRLSPSTVVAAIALIAALGGTAYAAGAITKAQKKQVEKIATRVFDSRVGDASVKRAATAGKAETADRATEALHAAAASRADVASKANEATKATEAAKAAEATHAAQATQAVTAENAEQLAGKPAAGYQDRVAGSCAPPSSISTVLANGQVECTSPVQPVRLEMGANGTDSQDLANGLRVEVACRANMEVTLRNVGNAAANVNFMLVDTGERVNIAGGRLAPGEALPIITITGRSEGQVVWVTPTAVTTIDAHFIRTAAGAFCEFTGTAMTGLG